MKTQQKKTAYEEAVWQPDRHLTSADLNPDAPPSVGILGSTGSLVGKLYLGADAIKKWRAANTPPPAKTQKRKPEPPQIGSVLRADEYPMPDPRAGEIVRDQPSLKDVFQPAWPTLPTSHFFDGMFAPEDVRRVVSGGGDARFPLSVLRRNLHLHDKVSSNPVRATKRKYLVIRFSPGACGGKLDGQWKRISHLSKTAPCVLCVYDPSSLTLEGWLDVQSLSKSRIADVARTAMATSIALQESTDCSD
jgi:hypothetical protein